MVSRPKRRFSRSTVRISTSCSTAELWDEYIERCPEGYRYSRFCELYRGWASRLSVTMRQAHIGGDKLFVDYAGDTVPVIVDRLTGQVRQAQIFVAVTSRRP
jgi:transposase